MSKFIVVDGIDGAGKSGIVAKMSEFFTNAKVDHIVTFEPGGTEFANFIRKGLRSGFDQLKEEPDYMAELLMFTAARADHVAKVIRPALKAGKLVLCDRYVDSTIAYQGVGRGLGDSKVLAVHNAAIGLYADHTFIIDGDPALFMSRNTGTDDYNKLDQLGLAFYIKARESYLATAKTHSSKYSVINGEPNREQVFAQILPHLMTIQNNMCKRPIA